VKNIAQNVAQYIVLTKLMHYLSRENDVRSPKMSTNSAICKKTTQSKKSPIGRKFAQSGTDVMILKIFSPKKFCKKLAFLTENKAKLCKMLIITLVLEKNANFFAKNCQKSQKIVIITSTPDSTIPYVCMCATFQWRRLRLRREHVGW
jgi:hypothetical protein